MSVTAEKIRTELAGLDAAERAELAHYLIQSLDSGTDADAEAAWDAVLARRAEEIRSGRAVGIPAERVISELRAKYS